MTDLKTTSGTSHVRQAVVAVALCICIAYASVKGIGGNWMTWLLISSLPLVFWFTLTQNNKLYFLLFILIPVSISFKLEGGAVVGLPSEALIFLLMVFVLVASSVKPFLDRKILRHPLVILLFAEIIWMSCCALFSGDPAVSFKRVFMRLMFVQLFVVFGVHVMLKKEPRYYLPFILFGIGMIWPVISSFLFHSKFNFAQSAAYRMCGPFFADHTIYGAVIAFVIPMLLVLTLSNAKIQLRTALHFFIVLLTFFLIAAEVLSFSRASWISLMVSAVFGFLLLLRVKFRGILVLLIICGGVTAFYSDQIYETISKNEAISNKGDIGDHLLSVTNVQSDASNTERINRWICAWKMAVEKPVTGYGPGMYQFEYGRFQERIHMTRISTFSGNRGHAHSEFMTQLAETGFPGFVLFTVIVFSVIAYGMRIIYREVTMRSKLLVTGALLGLITFYVHGFFNAFLDSDKMAALVFSSIAIIIAQDLRQKQNEANPE